MSFLWKNKSLLALLVLIGGMGAFYGFDSDFSYTINAGFSLLHRADVSSLERFLYFYEANGAWVVVLLSFLGVLVPNCSVAALSEASVLMYGSFLGTLYSVLGIACVLLVLGLVARVFIVRAKK